MKNGKGQFTKGFTPWNKGGKHTEEAKRNMSEALKGRTVWNKGKKGLQFLSDEAKRNMSLRKKGNKYRLGKKHSEETKKEMSLARKGVIPKNIKQIAGWNKGTKGLQIPWNKGEKGLQIAWNKDKKCPQFTGANNANWKGGITPEKLRIRKSIEYRLWRKANMERDNFTCQKCGVRGGKLVVHHINNFADFKELRTSIENGITFCKNCHLDFHKKYGRKNNTKEQLLESYQ